MAKWFSPYQGRDWTPQRGYSDLFKECVRQLRARFNTRKTGQAGLDITTGQRLECVLQRGTYYLLIKAFNFGGYRDTGNYITPVFELDFDISRDPDGHDVFYDEVLVIEFPDGFPRQPPLFKLKGRPEFDNMGSHSHHIIGGYMCILASENDWNPQRDTVVSATMAALDWCIWHYNEHGR